MLKAFVSVVLAAAAALAIASPAAAAPICNDDSVYAVSGGWFPGFADYGLYTGDHCDAAYDIVSIDWSVGSWNVYYNGPSPSATLLGVYSSYETAVVTVTDGTDTDEFTLLVYPCFYGWSCPPL